MFDASHVEALASLAAWSFDQGGRQAPRASALYARLLQLAGASAELWCNLALCNWR